ncbi:MAG TPA: hypothetical protein VGD56_03745 [Gemmatirosa sp.]
MPRFRRLAALGAALLATAFASGCAGRGDATAPDGRPVTARVAVAASIGPVAQKVGDSTTLEIAVAYLHAAGDSVPLSVQRFTLTGSGTEQLPVTVNLVPCLIDPARQDAALGTGTNGVCVLRLDFTLRQGATVLDHETVVPVLARPGQTATVAHPVALYTVHSVSIGPAPSAPGTPLRLVVGQSLSLTATALDAAGQPVTSRTPQWSSTNPTVATVDSVSGVVTPRGPGQTTITAVVGGRSAVIVVAVVPAPASITVTAAGGAGAGTVTSQPAGIACQVAAGQTSGTCAFTFPGDAAVTLTATPAAGASFAAWGGDCATAGGLLTCTLTPSVSRTVAVTFVAFRSLGVTLTGNGDGTVTSQPAGIACSIAAAPIGSTATGTTSGTCTAPYLDGTSVTLTAAPGATSSFAGWSGACSGAALTCTVTLSGAASAGAVFTRLPVRLVVQPAAGNAGAGVVSTVDQTFACAIGGQTTNGSCGASVPVGTSVTLQAAATQGQIFLGWGGACASAGAAATCTLTVNGATTVTAAFAPPQTLTLTLVGAGGSGGRVTGVASPCVLAGGAATVVCTPSVRFGSTVTLVAAADSASTFAGWGGNCAGSGTASSCTVTLTQARTVTAAFQRRTAVVTLALSGSAAGSVLQHGVAVCTLPSGGGSTRCALTLPVDAAVAFSAQPSGGAQFQGWGGPCSGTGSCSFTVTGSTTLGATFVRNPVSVTVGADPQGTGSGTVTSSPAGVSCTIAGTTTAGACSTTVAAGSRVMLTAAAATGNGFAAWGGACAGQTGPLCTLASVTSGTNVTARFAPATTTLTIVPTGTSGGLLSTPPTQPPGGNVSCRLTVANGSTTTGRCVETFPIGATTTISATPDSNSVLTAWKGDCANTPVTSSTCTVAMSQARTVGAVFGGRTFALHVALGGSGAGRVSRGGSTACSLAAGQGATTCTLQVPAYAAVALTEAAAQGSTFAAWGGACAAAGGNASCSYTATRDTTVSARFAPASATLTIAADPASTGQGSAFTTDGHLSCQIAGTSASGACSYSYTAPPASVVLRATHDAFNQFVGWSGVTCAEGNGSATCSVALATSATARANFRTLPTVSVTPSASGTGSGTLTVTSPVSFSCTLAPGGTSGACRFTVPQNASVTLSVTPGANTGSFTYGGACAAQTGAACTFTANGTNNPTVTYRPRQYTVSVAPAAGNTGAGTVTSGGTLSCSITGSAASGGGCAVLYDAGSTVALTATANANNTFAGWSGACANTAVTSTTCTVAVAQALTVGVRFAGPYSIGAAGPGGSVNTGGGVVTGTGNLDCAFGVGSRTAGTCAASYRPNTAITYTATPDANSWFQGWVAPANYCVGTTAFACSFTATTSGDAVARFTAASTFQLSTKSNEAAPIVTGTVTVQTTGVPNQTVNAVNATATAVRFGRGNTVTLTAAPANATYIFGGWGGACAAYATNPVCTLPNYTGAGTTVTATFLGGG